MMSQSEMGEGMMEDQAQATPSRNTFHLSADMLPEGLAQKLQAGDKVTLTVVSPMDKEGDVEMECEGAEGEQESPEEEQGEDWEAGFRREMSPQEPQEEA